jgi:hypothetical protein
MRVDVVGNVWSRRGRIDYFLSEHPEFRYQQIDTIEGIEIFECTQCPSADGSPHRSGVGGWAPS